MLRHASDLEGYGINATDGPIGTIVDFLFDDATWLVRWFVVDTGAFLIGRKVLLPPSALSHTNHIGGELAVKLTRQQVKDSPDISIDQPVSRVMETNLYDFYASMGGVRTGRRGSTWAATAIPSGSGPCEAA